MQTATQGKEEAVVVIVDVGGVVFVSKVSFGESFSLLGSGDLAGNLVVRKRAA